MLSPFLVIISAVQITKSGIHDTYNIDFLISDQYISQGFRNSLAHYKLGIALEQEELIMSDQLKGLTQKFFQTDYDTVK